MKRQPTWLAKTMHRLDDKRIKREIAQEMAAERALYGRLLQPHERMALTLAREASLA